ncbi:g2284 [Coccomyxa elongata]
MTSEDKVEHDCIICASVLGTNGGTLTLLCGHPFCAECICRWRQRSWRCPVCRVMDGRELSVPPAASGGAGGGHLGGPRRSGGAAHVSARLRPMAEQLLAESGDNVLDVLLQLMEGIQDGTLPADMDGITPDQATGSSRAPPGTASLDRLVLNQLVTVLQATSALIAGRGGGRLQTEQQQQARPHSSHRRHRSPASPASAAVQRHSRRSRLHTTPSQTSTQPSAGGDSAEAQPIMREMATQTSDVSDDGASGSRQSRRTRASPPQRLDGATSISPRQTSPAGRGALPALAPDLASPGQLPDEALQAGQSSPSNGRTVLPERVGLIPEEAGATGLPIKPPEPATFDPVLREAAAVRSGSTLPERPADQPGSLDGLQAAHAEQALQVHIDEPIVSVVSKASGYVYPEASSISAANPTAAGATVQPESNGEDAPPSAATGETGRGSHALADRSEASPQTVPEALPAAPRRSSSGGVRALTAMFEQRRSLDGPPPAPPARLRGLGVLPGTSPDVRAQPRPADALLHDASAGHTQECPRDSRPPSQGGTEGPKPAQLSEAPAAMAVASYTPGPAAAVEQGSALVSAKPAVPLPASVFGGGHSGRGEPAGDPFADLLAGFGEAFAPRQTQPRAHNQSSSPTAGAARAPMEASAEPGEALPAAEPTESLPGAAEADAAAASPGSDSSLASAAPSSGSAGAAAAAELSHQPRVRVQGIQTDDLKAGVPSSPYGSGISATPDAAAAADTAALTRSNDGLYGCEDMSVNSSCFTSPALSPRTRPALRMPARRMTSSQTDEAHMPAPAAASRAATPRIVAPPNTAAHSLANSEANSPRIMAELAPGAALPIPLPLHGNSGAANMLASDTAACSGTAEEQRGITEAPERRQPSTPDISSAVGRSPRPSGSRPRPRARSGDREQLLLRAVDEVEALVDALLSRWNSMPVSQQPDNLAERMEELFLEASMLEAVRNNQVPKPRAMVEDILTRVTLLDAELARYTGPPAPTPCGDASGGVTPRTGGSAPAADAERPQLESPRPAAGHVQPTQTPQVPAARSGGGGRSASRSAAAGGAERRHRRPAALAAAAAASDAETAAQAAEADGALERFTEFLTRHESELQPRTRQIAELALALARLSLVNSPANGARQAVESHA